MSDHTLIVSFPDQSETFTLGVEAGMFWQRLESGERNIALVAHVQNVEVLRRMAAAKGCVLATEPSTVEGWVQVEVWAMAPQQPPARTLLRLIKGGLSE